MPDPPSDGSEVYGAYVKEELDRQQARKASFESRGLSVITTSGTLVTLLFGLAALSTKQAATFALPGSSKAFLVTALPFFVLAIAAGLGANVPWVYRNVTPAGLRATVDDKWGDTPSVARKRVARTQIDVLEDARKVNGVKAWIVFGAIACELVALVLVGIAVGIVVAD
jgi:hypothetical protein